MQKLCHPCGSGPIASETACALGRVNEPVYFVSEGRTWEGKRSQGLASVVPAGSASSKSASGPGSVNSRTAPLHSTQSD
jgi:hypothetical protein